MIARTSRCARCMEKLRGWMRVDNLHADPDRQKDNKTTKASGAATIAGIVTNTALSPL